MATITKITVTADQANMVLYCARRGLAALAADSSPEQMADGWAAFASVASHLSAVTAPAKPPDEPAQ